MPSAPSSIYKDYRNLFEYDHQMDKFCFLEVSDFDCFFNFCFKTYLIQRLEVCPDQKFDFLGETPDLDFSFDCLYLPI